MENMPRNWEISSELKPKSEVREDMMMALPVLSEKILKFAVLTVAVDDVDPEGDVDADDERQRDDVGGVEIEAEPDHGPGPPEDGQNQRREGEQQIFEALEMEEDQHDDGEKGPDGGPEIADAQQVGAIVIEDGRAGRLGRDGQHGVDEFLVRRPFPEILFAVDLEQDFTVAILGEVEALELRRDVGEGESAVGLLGLEQFHVPLHPGESAVGGGAEALLNGCDRRGIERLAGPFQGGIMVLKAATACLAILETL
jgi:hypothetical protein